jgi:hypothetical protein
MVVAIEVSQSRGRLGHRIEVDDLIDHGIGEPLECVCEHLLSRFGDGACGSQGINLFGSHHFSSSDIGVVQGLGPRAQGQTGSAQMASGCTGRDPQNLGGFGGGQLLPSHEEQNLPLFLWQGHHQTSEVPSCIGCRQALVDLVPRIDRADVWSGVWP